MSNADEIKGRIKEAAGDLTDNDRLKREGKADRVSGKAKEMLGDARDKIEDTVEDVKQKVREHT